MHRKCIERVMVLAVSASLWASLAQADGYRGKTMREYVLLTVRNGHYEAHPEGYATGIDLHAINLSKPADVLKEFRRLADKSSWMSIAF